MKDLVADATFYLCFLDDIQSPSDLIKILREFNAHTTQKIFDEVSKSPRVDLVSTSLNIFERGIPNLGEALRPLLSEKQIASGESDVLVLAYICYNLKMIFVLIIDDQAPRKFVKNNLSYLQKYLKYTTEFIGDCCLLHGVFKSNEAITLLNKIERSKFRAPKEVIKQEIKRIEDRYE